jgi:hypothetical protein
VQTAQAMLVKNRINRELQHIVIPLPDGPEFQRSTPLLVEPEAARLPSDMAALLNSLFF